MADARALETFARLVDVMARLRAPGGCPWDREQTPESLRPYVLEEAYEVIEAIEHEDRRRFVVAVQWHPEDLVDHDAAARALFSAVVEAARARGRS